MCWMEDKLNAFFIMTFIWYILIGLAAGYVAGQLTRGRGFGLLVNLIVGIVGGVLGGLIFGALGFSVNPDSITGNLVSSVVGAILLLGIASLFRRK